MEQLPSALCCLSYHSWHGYSSATLCRDSAPHYAWLLAVLTLLSCSPMAWNILLLQCWHVEGSARALCTDGCIRTVKLSRKFYRDAIRRARRVDLLRLSSDSHQVRQQFICCTIDAVHSNQGLCCAEAIGGCTVWSGLCDFVMCTPPSSSACIPLKCNSWSTRPNCCSMLCCKADAARPKGSGPGRLQIKFLSLMRNSAWTVQCPDLSAIADD